MNEVINDLGGELLSMFVPPDSWAPTVMAWMKKSSTILKVIGVEIPLEEPGLYYSSPPRTLRTMLGMYMYRVFVHVEEVVNPSIEVLPPLLVPGPSTTSITGVNVRLSPCCLERWMAQGLLHRAAEATASLGEEAGLAAWMCSNLR